MISWQEGGRKGKELTEHNDGNAEQVSKWRGKAETRAEDSVNSSSVRGRWLVYREEIHRRCRVTTEQGSENKSGLVRVEQTGTGADTIQTQQVE